MHGNALCSSKTRVFMCEHSLALQRLICLVEPCTEGCDVRQITETAFGKHVRRELRGHLYALLACEFTRKLGSELRVRRLLVSSCYM